MIRIFLLAGWLSLTGMIAASAAVVPAMAVSANSALAVESQDSVSASGPETNPNTPARFRGGDMFTFNRYVRDNLIFPEMQYTEGECLRLVVKFRVTKEGRVKAVELLRPSGDPVDKEVLRLVRESTGWTPAKNGNTAGWETLSLDMILVSDAAGVFHAEDHLVYREADAMPVFEGGGPKVFRAWIVERVGDRWPDGSPINERVTMRFVIEKDGSMSDMSVWTGEEMPAWLSGRIKEELAATPRWEPAVRQGEKVRFEASQLLLFGEEAARAAADTTFRCDDDAFMVAETMPSFLGGDLYTFRQWVMQHVKYPYEALSRNIKGRVVVCFVIERNGSLTILDVVQSPDPMLTQVVVKALKNSPKWTPGVQGGRVVKVKYTLPVDFSFSTPTPSSMFDSQSDQ